jgi:predicted nucleotidyltransferase component of viral defense system
MIDEETLVGLSGHLRDVRQLERDYLLVLLLHEIYSVFTNELIFKGGTALRYLHNLNRFSEDIDFSYAYTSSDEARKHLNSGINVALDRLNDQYEVVERESRATKAADRVVGINYEIRVRGPLNKRSGNLQNINIDLSLRNDVLHKPEPSYITPIYPDIATLSLPVMEINEMLAEKISAVAKRVKMRDIYDIYYLLVIKKLKYNEKLVEEKMRRRAETFKKEDLAKNLNTATSKMKWKSELAYLVDPLPDNLKVVSELKKIIGL